MIQFNEIGSNRSPNNPNEFANAGPVGDVPRPILLIAQRLSSGTVPANTPVEITGETQGDAYHGVGSYAAELARVIKGTNPEQKLISIGITAAGDVAAGSLGFSGTATAAGSLDFYIGGRFYQLAVASGTAAAAILTAYKALIAADARRLVEDGTIGSGAIPLTARISGPTGNAIKIVQTSPDVPGITVAITQLTGGATEASLAAAISAAASEQYFDIVTTCADTTSLTALKAEMASRFTAARELEGVVIVAAPGTVSDLTTIGSGHNSQHLCILDAGASPTPPWTFAANAAARDAQVSDPGQPRYGLTLDYCIAPVPASRRTHSERNTLLGSGISTVRVAAGDVVVIDRLVTTYQTDVNGIPDDTHRSIETAHTLSDYRQSKKRLTAQFRTYKLVDDGTVLDPGVLAVTPSFMRAVLVEHYDSYVKRGLMEGTERYAANLIVQRSTTDKNRLDTQERVDVGNQLVTLAGKIIVAL